jgi:polyisoprenoid-binding protein YceI
MRTLLAILACAGALCAASYTIQPEPGARFALEVHKTGLMSGKVHVFEYERYSGTVEFDPAKPEAARIDLRINAASIVCKDTWIDDKDKKKVVNVALDMMQHANFPELRFTSTNVTRRADGGFDVAGNLTLKGISKPVTVNVTMKQEGAQWEFSGKAVILRKDYKINPPSPVPFGVIGNKEEMPVSFRLMAKPGK